MYGLDDETDSSWHDGSVSEVDPVVEPSRDVPEVEDIMNSNNSEEESLSSDSDANSSLTEPTAELQSSEDESSSRQRRPRRHPQEAVILSDTSLRRSSRTLRASVAEDLIQQPSSSSYWQFWSMHADPVGQLRSLMTQISYNADLTSEVDTQSLLLEETEDGEIVDGIPSSQLRLIRHINSILLVSLDSTIIILLSKFRILRYWDHSPMRTAIFCSNASSLLHGPIDSCIETSAERIIYQKT